MTDTDIPAAGGEKISTGIRRLDDLMYGGLAKRSNVLVYGAPFLGKEVLINAFVIDGLKKNIPAVFVLTDKTPDEVLELMSKVTPDIKKYNENGLLTFVDAYSKSMGIERTNPHTFYVADTTRLLDLNRVIEDILKAHPESQVKKLAFHSISTLLAYNPPMENFRFMQKLASDCREQNTVGLYDLEAGMHTGEEVQTIKHLMYGSINLQADDLKTFLRVEGITDVRTRAWIEYTYDNRSIMIKGAFAVDHMR